MCVHVSGGRCVCVCEWGKVCVRACEWGKECVCVCTVPFDLVVSVSNCFKGITSFALLGEH